MGRKVNTPNTLAKPITLYLNIETCSVDVDSNGESITPTIPLVTGRDYFLVYVIYSTGDSNGRDKNHRCETIDAYETYDAALATGLAIQHNYECDLQYSDKKGQTKLPVHLADGSLMTDKYLPWSGYFEALEFVHVLRFNYNATPSHTIIDRYTKF